MKSNNEVQLSSSNSVIISDMSHKSKDSSSYYENSDCYNQKVIDKLRERSKKEMNKMCKKYGFDHEFLRLLVEVEFDPDPYYKLKVNGMMHDHDFHRDWINYINK